MDKHYAHDHFYTIFTDLMCACDLFTACMSYEAEQVLSAACGLRDILIDLNRKQECHVLIIAVILDTRPQQ